VIVYVARDTPIDQYFVNHPEFIQQAPIERAWLNANNPYILLQHLPCAAHEHPLRSVEPSFPEPAYTAALAVLRDDKTIVDYRGDYRYALRDYPAKGVNLRGMTDYNIEIYCGTEVIGELDPIGARGTLYKDAIYQHLGRRYMSMELDLEKKLCRVDPVDVDYYTDATWESRITLTDSLEKAELNGGKLDFGYVNVNRQPKMYKKIRERTLENIGYGPITLDPFIYDTTGFNVYPPEAWRESVTAVDHRHVGAALYGLSYILRRTAPSLCLGDVQDIETDVSSTEVEPKIWRSALYLYDSIEGGVGYAEKIFEAFPEALQLCRHVIEDCSCESGCPACVTALPPGVVDEELEQLLIETNAAVACTKSLLDTMLSGSVVLPTIVKFEVGRLPRIDPPEEDAEVKRLKERLGKAGEILKKKRARIH
jgi:DEAD/DEAH box helicase domain-containing protein